MSERERQHVMHHRLPLREQLRASLEGSLADHQRLMRALHPLDAPPLGDGWNRSELEDLLPPGTLVEAAVLAGIVPRVTGAGPSRHPRTGAGEGLRRGRCRGCGGVGCGVFCGLRRALARGVGVGVLRGQPGHHQAQGLNGELFGRARRAELAAMEDGDPVGERQQLVEILRDQQDGGTTGPRGGSDFFCAHAATARAARPGRMLDRRGIGGKS